MATKYTLPIRTSVDVVNVYSDCEGLSLRPKNVPFSYRLLRVWTLLFGVETWGNYCKLIDNIYKKKLLSSILVDIITE